MNPRRWLCPLMLISGLIAANGAAAQTATPDIYSASDFGGVGLLNMRTARFAPDGQFAAGAVFVEPYRRYYMNWQILPFLEVTFRYTDITNVRTGGGIVPQGQGEFFKDIINLRGGDTLLDRAFDFKLKVWDEGRIRPAFAVGLQDTVGTGLFSGEYLVFTKRIADFDVTAGLGWGYLGTRGGIANPFRAVSSGFDVRNADVGEGGKFGFGNFFSGRHIGIFGGVEYFTPIRSLSLKLEYNSVDPAAEPVNNPQPESLPINVGVNWRPHDWMDLSVGLERGNTVMLRFSLSHNLKEGGLPKVMDPPPAAVTPRSDETAPDEAPAQAQGPERNWRDVTASHTQTRHHVTPLYRPSIDYKTKFGNAGADREWQDEDFNPASLTRLLADQGPPARPDSAWRMAARSDASSPITSAKPRAGGGTSKAAIPRARPHRAAGPPGQAVEPGQPVDATPTPPPVWRPEAKGLTSGASGESERAVAETVFAELGARGYTVEAIDLAELTATVYFADTRYRAFAKNLGRISRILANHLPTRIEVFTLVHIGNGLETSRVSVFRKDIEDAAQNRGSPSEILANAEIKETHLSQTLPADAIRNDLYPAFTWSIAPELRQHLGNPDVGIWAADLRLSASARVKLRRNLWVTAGASKFVAGNLDELKRSSSSALPHVRSDIRQYVQQGRNSLDHLQLDYLFRPARNLYGRVSAGIFETMYGGVGGEVLWHRPGSRLALGLDLNWVKKRDFDQGFGFQDYDTVTGHFSIYYDLPFYNMDAAAHIGRYLARDHGLTVDISREFESGVTVGAFVTVTDVPSERFGEGSFDKGFYMRIPLDMFLLRSSPQTTNFLFRPLTRDGGQRVNVSPRLKDLIAEDRPTQIRRSWDAFMD